MCPFMQLYVSRPQLSSCFSMSRRDKGFKFSVRGFEAMKPSERFIFKNEVVWGVVEYLLVWPFMCHVGLVLVGAWIVSYLRLNISFFFLLSFIYLFQIEKRQREKNQRKIRYEEKIRASKMRFNEGETVRWLNQAVESIWPVFLENFASQVLLLPLSPYFLNAFKPWTAKKVLVQHLCLGKTPPTITMIRSLDQPTDGDHMAIEATIDFVASKDMSAVLAVQVRRRLGLGLWTSLHISNLHVEGKVKISLKFVKGWPVVGRTRFCFATAPFVQITARPLFNHGVDVAELPGIAQWLDRMMADALEQSLVEPNYLEVDVEKLVRDLLIPQGVSGQPKPADWFFMHARPHVANIIVEVLEATELRIADMNGYSDPFVKGELAAKRFVTKVKWKTLSPKWNESFKLPVANWDLPNVLLLRVLDKDRFHDDELGICAVEINEYRDGKRHDFWVPLKEVKTGKIHLAITVVDVAADAQSSDESGHNSTTFETSSQELMPEGPSGNLLVPVPPGDIGNQQLGRSSISPTPLEILKDQKPVSSSTQVLKTQTLFAKASESGSTPSSPSSTRLPEKTKTGGLFQSSRTKSLRKKSSTVNLENKKQVLGEDVVSPTGIPSDGKKTPPMLDSTQTVAEAEDRYADDCVKVIDVGCGERGAVSIRQLGDAEPTNWPCQKIGGSKKVQELIKRELVDETSSLDRSSSESESLCNVEEEGGPARKLRSAGLKLNRHFHRQKKAPVSPSTECDPSGFSSEACLLLPNVHMAAGQQGTMVHLTLENVDGQPLHMFDHAATGCHLHEPKGLGTPIRDSSSEVLGTENNAVEVPAHHVRNTAAGLLNMAGKAATHMGHQLSRKMKSRKSLDATKEGPLSPDEHNNSSCELNSTGEPLTPLCQLLETSPRAFTPTGDVAGSEISPKRDHPTSETTTLVSNQQQVDASNKNESSSYKGSTISEPPTRPPPELPLPSPQPPPVKLAPASEGSQPKL